MKCIICNSDTTTIVKETYKCVKCSHIYVNYLNDGLDYHKNEYF